MDVESKGKDADPTIFNCSTFGKPFSDIMLNIPSPENILSSIVPLVSYVLVPYVRDEAFGIEKKVREFLTTCPYPSGDMLNVPLKF